MRRETQNVLLVLVGGALVKIVVDGTYLRYVRPWSAPTVLAAGLMIVVLAAVAIVRDLRVHGVEPDLPPAHRARSAWFLLLPVLAILLVAPPALGSGAITGVGTRIVTAAAGTVEQPLPPGDAPALDVVDLVSRAVSHPRGALVDHDVSLTGFAIPATDGHDLARLVISCCAADASAVRIHLADPEERVQAPPGGPDQWFRLRGRYVAGTGGAADHVPTVRVVEAVPIPPPDPVYEY